MRHFLSILLVIATIAGIAFMWSIFAAFLKEANIPDINESEYRQLQKGMTLEDVTEVVGKKPELLSQRNIHNTRYQVFLYKERFRLFKEEASVHLYFFSGRLILVNLNGSF
ncbi:hypothetical protein [Cohnella sp. GbtcB17]|uniref:hypothetical protein n=1 Tax=Cohnella sp. GbtcB17 TaxID=2824762 RepID=UPI001C2F4A77|nr:hypothetical protein [Cohnella sp. GbtcB17]